MFRLLTVLLILCLTPCLAFSETASLTLDDAIKFAIENNPELKAAKSKLGISQADIVSAAARPNPNLLTDNGIAEKTYRLGIEQTIELGGKRSHRIQVAEAQNQAVIESINTTLLDLKTKVRKAFTQLYYFQQREVAYQEIYDSTQKLLTIAEKREEAGDIAKLDVLQATIASVNVSNELQTISSQLAESWNTLNTVINTPFETRYSLVAPSKLSVTMPELKNLFDMAYQNRPELKQLQKSITVAEQELKLAQANKIPNLSLTVGPDLVTNEGGSKQLNVFAVANVNIPVWNRQQGAIQKAIATKFQLENEINAQKSSIRLEISNAYNRYLAQQNRITRYETDILPKSLTVLEKARNSFNEGKSDIIISINAQQSYINTKLGYLQALLDFQNAITDLERAIGTNL